MAEEERERNTRRLYVTLAVATVAVARQDRAIVGIGLGVAAPCPEILAVARPCSWNTLHETGEFVKMFGADLVAQSYQPLRKVEISGKNARAVNVCESPSWGSHTHV
jgi:hypothetical protein